MAAVELHGKRLLIVEDDTFLHTLLAGKLASLREKGVDVVPLLNAEEALKSIDERIPDLVLLDLVLPGLNGFDFLERLRANDRTKKVPVIILSNLSDTSDRERATTLGVVAYHVKADLSLQAIADDIERFLKESAAA